MKTFNQYLNQSSRKKKQLRNFLEVVLDPRLIILSTRLYKQTFNSGRQTGVHNCDVEQLSKLHSVQGKNRQISVTNKIHNPDRFVEDGILDIGSRPIYAFVTGNQAFKFPVDAYTEMTLAGRRTISINIAHISKKPENQKSLQKLNKLIRIIEANQKKLMSRFFTDIRPRFELFHGPDESYFHNAIKGTPLVSDIIRILDLLDAKIDEESQKISQLAKQTKKEIMQFSMTLFKTKQRFTEKLFARNQNILREMFMDVGEFISYRPEIVANYNQVVLSKIKIDFVMIDDMDDEDTIEAQQECEKLGLDYGIMSRDELVKQIKQKFGA